MGAAGRRSILTVAAVSSSQTVKFEDASDYLALTSPGSFAGLISGFADGDTIDLVNQAATSLSYSSGVLDVFNGMTEIAALSFSGSYSPSSFILSSDGRGGNEILDPLAAKA